MRDSAAPASPPPPAPSMDPAELEATARAAHKMAKRSIEAIGRSPSATDPNDKGVGLLGALARLSGEVSTGLSALGTRVEALAKAIDDDRRAREASTAAIAARREPLARVGWIVLGAALTVIVGSALLGLGAYLRAHWH